MAPLPRNPKRANQRKWSARAWWVGLHVYSYGVLVYNGAMSPKRLGTSDFLWAVAVAVVNLIAYVAVQTSSPGYVETTKTRDLEAAKKKDDEQSREESDEDRLVPQPANEPEVDAGAHYCDDCQIKQPLRAKHCKDCARCVRQYDHHCDCAGTCVGQNNRHRFILYLFTQVVEGFEMIGVAAAAFTMQPSVDEWFQVNWPYIIAWFSVVGMLFIAIPLLCYQLYLISVNQTSWEYARRSSITYLRDLPDDKSPFDRGFLYNWRVFLTQGDGNQWVHSSKPLRQRADQLPPLDTTDTSFM
ncbi:hypothetical protein Poli38472_003577 [Pythium oligandrum]|uniref:Palmitoyltransferase n=1 Tax=Pythium oligandrum TaxID=41045 RepID=A0A8K1CLQ3_PYTOL|nr:hypothetical protein Poli38472_003577 [Pythium oligandrum]|eukprot:TMW65812.1 hypothetical protein Poli38472_003577 [Pythium oligandrum]